MCGKPIVDLESFSPFSLIPFFFILAGFDPVCRKCAVRDKYRSDTDKGSANQGQALTNDIGDK